MKQKTNQTEAAPDSQRVITDNIEPKSIRYVVVRGGFRVSDREYTVMDDPTAINEKEFWTRVSNNHSYGETVEVVQYDSKKHRVW